MANVTFHIGTSTPNTSGLTAGGLYVDSTNGKIWYASSETAKIELGRHYDHVGGLTSHSWSVSDCSTSPDLLLLCYYNSSENEYTRAASTSLLMPYGTMMSNSMAYNIYYGTATLIKNSSGSWVMAAPKVNIPRTSPSTSTSVTWYNTSGSTVSTNTNFSTKIFRVNTVLS